ncbi:transposase, partial [Rhizobium leguminosarum]|nr:transposase [Rhizobium leguminosarum]
VVGCEVFRRALKKYPTIKGVCADASYRKTMKVFVEQVLKKTIVISQRITAGWAVIAKRWIVERTFAWFNHFRRLSKDYEIAVKSAENMAMIAHSMVLLNRFNYL